MHQLITSQIIDWNELTEDKILQHSVIDLILIILQRNKSKFLSYHLCSLRVQNQLISVYYKSMKKQNTDPTIPYFVWLLEWKI